MNKLLILLAASLTVCCSEGARGNLADSESVSGQVPTPTSRTVDTIPAGALALIEAYPDWIKGYSNDSILLKDGSAIVYDDHRDKDFTTMLDDSDIEDMFSMTYEVRTPPSYLADAGRSRSEMLFKKMYGSSSAAVQATLVPVRWFGQTVRFTSVNGAADSLRAVAADIAGHPDFKSFAKYLQSSGTFYWRKVRGARRQSAHSYGIAFDIAVPHSDYWLWKNPAAKETDSIAYANRIPLGLVEIFQRHGFIWGGAWYHFDTMHFEFRPEILGYARSLSESTGKHEHY